MDQLNDFLEGFGSNLLDTRDEFLDFLVVGLVDDELVGLFHIVIEFCCELSVGKQFTTDSDIAVILVIGILIVAK